MGRPKGSKNKPKAIVIPGITPSPIWNYATYHAPREYPGGPDKCVEVKPAQKHNDFYTRHKGPYTLLVHRVKGKKVVSEHLPGRIAEGEDVEAEARALLDDPRDTIDSVNVWSEREEQYVTCFKKVGNG